MTTTADRTATRILAQSVWFDDTRIYVELTDGRVVGAPMAWFPHLLRGTPEQRADYELFDEGGWIHWESLDEDLSAEGMLTFSR